MSGRLYVFEQGTNVYKMDTMYVGSPAELLYPQRTQESTEAASAIHISFSLFCFRSCNKRISIL